MPNTLFLIASLAMIAVVVALFVRARKKLDKAQSPSPRPTKKPSFFSIDDSGGFKGMRTWPSIGRWAAVLPFALFGLLAMTWFLRSFISVFHIGLQDVVFVYLLQPLGSLLSHLGFVLGGWAAAPRWRVAVACVLGAGLIALDLFMLPRGLPVLALIGSIAGIAIAVYQARKAQAVTVLNVTT
ncbi:hypothetical protein BH11PSE13_BH11PSE13_27620 [soil metagenome]